MKEALTLLDPRVRMWFYLVLGAFALAVGVLNEFHGDNDPQWVEGLVRVSLWLAPLIAVPAATHVPQRTVEQRPKHYDADGDGFADVQP